MEGSLDGVAGDEKTTVVGKGKPDRTKTCPRTAGYIGRFYEYLIARGRRRSSSGIQVCKWNAARILASQ